MVLGLKFSENIFEIIFSDCMLVQFSHFDLFCSLVCLFLVAYGYLFFES